MNVSRRKRPSGNQRNMERIRAGIAMAMASVGAVAMPVAAFVAAIAIVAVQMSIVAVVVLGVFMLVIAVRSVFCLPIALVLLWGLNAAFGLSLPITLWSVAAASCVLACIPMVLGTGGSHARSRS